MPLAKANGTRMCNKILIGDTGVLDTLYQEVLAEGIENNQGRNDHKTAGVTDCSLVKRLSCITKLQGRRNLAYQVNEKRVGSGGFDDLTNVEVIGPLPAECKQEYGYHHGDGKRQNDLNKGAEGAATVHVSGLFKLIGNSTEELTEQENVQTVLECQAGSGEQNQGQIGFCNVNTGLLELHYDIVAVFVNTDNDLLGQNIQFAKELGNALAQLHYVPIEDLNSAALEKTYDAQNIKVTELEIHGVLQGLVRNDHGDHNQNEDEIAAAEFEFCKSVSDQATNQHLDNCCGE